MTTNKNYNISKKKESNKELPNNTLLCSNFASCKQLVRVGPLEDKDVMIPLCLECEKSLMERVTANDDDLEQGQTEENEGEVVHDTFIPFNFDERDEQQVMMHR